MILEWNVYKQRKDLGAVLGKGSRLDLQRVKTAELSRVSRICPLKYFHDSQGPVDRHWRGNRQPSGF